MFPLAFGITLAADALTKRLVVRALAPGRVVPAETRSPIHLRRVDNLPLWGSRSVLLACWVASVAGSVLLALTVFDGTTLAQVGLGLAAGGATGNAVDRLRGRSVVDFVQLPGWRLFNVADAAITCGIALTVWAMI